MRQLKMLVLIILAMFVCTTVLYATESDTDEEGNEYEYLQEGTQLPSINGVPSGTNSFQDTDTRMVELKSVYCKYGKGRVIGEKVHINTFMEGYNLNAPIDYKFKTGINLDINETYDFMDELVFSFWDDNIFNDHHIGQIRIANDSPNGDQVTVLKTSDVELEVHYKIMPGQGYKPVIKNLKRILANQNERINQLEDENSSLRRQNYYLESKVNELEQDIIDLKNELTEERAKNS